MLRMLRSMRAETFGKLQYCWFGGRSVVEDRAFDVKCYNNSFGYKSVIECQS